MEVSETSPSLVLTLASKGRSRSCKLFCLNNVAVRLDLPVFCRGSKEKRGRGRTAGRDEEKQEKMLWLRINKSPKAKQVSNIHRIATAYRRRRRRRRRHFQLTYAPSAATTAQSVKRPVSGLVETRISVCLLTRTTNFVFSTPS